MPVAIITGASRGLGLATARALAGQGWSVVADARRAEQLQTAAGGIDAAAGVAAAAGLAPGRFVTVPGDVTDPGHRAELVAAARSIGTIALLMNNASRSGPARSRALPPIRSPTWRRSTRSMSWHRSR